MCVVVVQLTYAFMPSIQTLLILHYDIDISVFNAFGHTSILLSVSHLSNLSMNLLRIGLCVELLNHPTLFSKHIFLTD